MMENRRHSTRGKFVLDNLLVVDDSEDDVKLIKRYLADTVRVMDSCSDFEEAISLIKNKKYDLVLMDVNLGLLDTSKEIQKIYAINPNLQLILMSGADLRRDGELVSKFMPRFLNKDKLSALADLIICQNNVKELKEALNGK